jgi:aminotransferase
VSAPHSSQARTRRASRHVAEIVEAKSIKYNNRVYERTGRGEDTIVLSLGEANFDIPLFPLDDLPMPDVYHYSHSRGIPELRALLAESYQSRYGVTIDPATEIIVTAGSKIALYMAFTAILDPGDDVLIPEPAWVSYTEQVRLCHARPVGLPYDTTVSEYERFITDRTRAIVVNNPNNPTGRLLTRGEWEQLHGLAERYGLYLVSDEGYSDYVLDPGAFISAAAFDPAKVHTIVCNTLSKNYGVSGWRLGYVFTDAELLFQILKVNQHLMTCPATILEWYMVRHLQEVCAITAPQIREVVLRRQQVGRLLDHVGLRYLPGDGAFYLFVSIEESRLRSEEFSTRLLEERGVSVVPGIGYGASCDQFIRVSVGGETLERIRTGVERLAQFVRETAAARVG